MAFWGLLKTQKEKEKEAHWERYNKGCECADRVNELFSAGEYEEAELTALQGAEL
ncbi:MAG: hypothetical protein Q4D07_05095 [Selenomonadaceae bacterium]|nr:hypothetical protein [Selenomonadaceae bacterium]